MDRQHVLFIVAYRSVERRLRSTLAEQYEVKVARLRREALESLEESLPDLVLVDVESVRFDISRFFDELTALPLPVMTFLLLNQETRLDRLPQANGHLRRPFTERQLMRRLTRVLPAGPRETIEWRGLCLDIENHFLIWRGQQAPLTPKQAYLALTFMTSPEEIVSRERLMKEVWGTDYMGDTRTLDVHVHWFRKALERVAAPFVLKTHRGVGYALMTDAGEETA